MKKKSKNWEIQVETKLVFDEWILYFTGPENLVEKVETYQNLV